MNPGHGLADTALARIRAVLACFPEVERAVLFGSRAKGTHKPGSDIDLALQGHALDWQALGRMEDALDDLFLPHTFSLVCLDEKTDPALAAHVDRVGWVLYQRTGTALARPVPAG